MSFQDLKQNICIECGGDRVLQKKKYSFVTEKIKKQISIYDDSDIENVVSFLTNLANVIR